MEFDSLPNEILEQITLNLDGLTLFRAKQTCKRWRNVVEYAETSLNLWKVLCIREIPTDLLTELSGFKELDDETIDYRNVYLKYHRQRRLKNTSDYVFTNFSISDDSCNDFDCKCIKISDDSLLTGHRNGNVMLWDTRTGRFVRFVATHMKSVTSLAFVDCYAHELTQRKIFDRKEAGSSHHNFLTASKDRTMKCVSNSLDQKHRDIHFNSYVKTIRVFGKKVAVLCEQGQIFVFQMTLRDEFRLEQLHTVEPIARDVSRFNWMGFWIDTLTRVSSSMDCYTSKFGQTFSSCHPPSLIETNDQNFGGHGDVVVVACYLFRKNIKILITVDRYLLVSTDGHRYRLYSTMKDLKGTVTSVAVSGNLLVLGTNTGMLYLYYLESDSDLVDLRLDRPAWYTQASDREAIVAVEIKLDASEPLIVAANRKVVFLVRFVAPAKANKEVGFELSKKYFESLFINGK